MALSLRELIGDKALAYHEVGHAYGGLSCGRWGEIIELSIVPCADSTARCVWRERNGRIVPKSEENGEIATLLAGPITQIWFAPESAGTHLDVLSNSVVQHEDFYKDDLFCGWIKDVKTCLYFRTRNIPKQYRIPWENIEAKYRSLLERSSVRSAIVLVAEELIIRKQLEGAEAEALFQSKLGLNDTPGFEYYQ